jgi:hypothetical protein
VTPALLRAAVVKARGALTALDVTGCAYTVHLALREVLAANAGTTLRELRCLRGRDRYVLSVPMLEAMLSAAPQLRVCEADLYINASEARRALRNEGVLGPLRVRYASLVRPPSSVPLFAGVAAHTSLAELSLHGARLDVPAVLDAFVDAALSLPLLRTVELCECRLSPASAPALARLLSSGTLTELTIRNDHRALLDAPAAAVLADALRANTTLTSLALDDMRLWSDRAAAAMLLGALTGHSSLRELDCSGNGITDAIARDVLLPAVRANTSLRTLTARAINEERSGVVLLAEALVKSRG